MVSHTDFLPSLTGLLSLSFAGSERATLPGRSYAPSLEGGAVGDWQNELYYEFENLRCIRTGSMKWIKRLDEAPDELYDLAADPMEKNNLATHPACAEKRKAPDEHLDSWFTQTANPEFDVWRQGRSITCELRRLVNSSQ
jgi:choline-sulfatase